MILKARAPALLRRLAPAFALVLVFALAPGLLVLSAPVRAAAEAAPRPIPVRVTVHDLKLDGRAQRLLLLMPPAPRAVLVMLPGGAGDLGIKDDGSLAHGENFLVRTRGRFAARGFALVIVDAVDGQNLRGARASPAYKRIVSAIAALARKETGRPVFLMGTSQGTIAAMNGAAGAEDIAGLVLTESVSRLGASGETVFSADPAVVTAPTLIIANAADTCPVTPPADAARIAESLTHARTVKVVTVSGGTGGGAGRACKSLSPHGYRGMEDEVVTIIAGWIDAQLDH